MFITLRDTPKSVGLSELPGTEVSTEASEGSADEYKQLLRRKVFCNPLIWILGVANPFSVPFPLGIFLVSVWVMLIVGLAAVDDVRHHLPLGEATLSE